MSNEHWIREFHEAVKLSDDISCMISDSDHVTASLTKVEEKRYLATIRRKITILRTKIDAIQSFLLLPNNNNDNPM